MKKRLWWSMLFSSAALLVTSVTMFAQRPSVDIYTDPVGRAPALRAPIPPRVPATYPGTSNFKAWEGFSSTNYLNRTTPTFSANFADIAVGPMDILTVVNRRIARWRNPNALGAAPVLDGTNPSNEALLDAWLGEYALKKLCPSMFAGGGPAACLIEHATVKYDQMHGRFVVLMNVIDTGLTSPAGNTQPALARRATWVMAVSRFATFILGNSNYQNPNPNGSGTTATSDLFISPTPPGATGTSVTGGWNTDNWSFYLGDPDNEPYGNVNTATVEGVAATTAGATMVGVTGAVAPFDCSAGVTNNYCYLPTGARLGFDNDNVIVTSPVFNVNLLTANGQYTAANAFAGTRVRVFKKTFLYTAKLSQNNLPDLSKIAKPVPGITMPGVANSPTLFADFYDLYATKLSNNVWVPLTAAADFGNTAANISPYTLAPPNGVTINNANYLQAAFCEPQHLRGRPAASFSNAMIAADATFANLNTSAANGKDTSNSYIECILDTSSPYYPVIQNTVYIQPISYITGTTNAAANVNPLYTGILFAPQLQYGANATVAGTVAQMQFVNVPNFVNPGTVPQAKIRSTGAVAPKLFVGNDRPQRVIFREGHLYDARVAASTQSLSDCQVGPLPGQGNNPTASANCLNATVEYDIVQATNVGFAQNARKVVLHAEWWNTWAWAPMYDVPANVTLSGQVSPINTFGWLEKLFVATTYPALSLTDPRGAAQSENGAFACQGPPSPGYDPSIPVAYANVAYAGLFDMRCGTDAYDTVLQYKDPVGGQYITGAQNANGDPIQVVSLSTRNGAAIDPNDGSLWNYGLYATRRFASTNGVGQWSTYVANYGLTYQNAISDPYGNGTLDYKDVPPSHPFYGYVQIARNVGIILPPNGGVDVGGAALANPNGTVIPANTSGAGSSDINTKVTRAEMAELVIKSLMDETAITNFLNATGGCTNSFADVTDPGCAGKAVTNKDGTLTLTAAGGYSKGGWRYIETMARRGITKGCGATNDARALFCPESTLKRGEMAVFLIRAKLNNVFVTSLNGCPGVTVGSGIPSGVQGAIPGCIGGQGGDGFDNFVAAKFTTKTNNDSSAGYFCDVASGAVPATLAPACTAAGIAAGSVIPNDNFWIYIQKLFELRISNGTVVPTIDSDNSINVQSQGVFARNTDISRGEVLVFVVRAFFL